MKRIVFTIIFLCGLIVLQAQDNPLTKPQSENFMRSSGRIYVVVAVILVILSGMFLYLFRLDQKVSRIEREIHE